jgi:Fur family iron response transcriptional regulator
MTTSRTMVFTNYAEATAPNAAERAALTGCPWHDVKAMLREVGLRPTRQRMALGWILFAKGDRHITAEMLYEEATKAKVPVSLATVYNTLHQFTDVGLLRQVAVDGSKTYFDTNASQHHHTDVVVGKTPVPPEGYEIARIDVVVRLRRKGR